MPVNSLPLRVKPQRSSRKGHPVLALRLPLTIHSKPLSPPARSKQRLGTGVKVESPWKKYAYNQILQLCHRGQHEMRPSTSTCPRGFLRSSLMFPGRAEWQKTWRSAARFEPRASAAVGAPLGSPCSTWPASRSQTQPLDCGSGQSTTGQTREAMASRAGNQRRER